MHMHTHTKGIGVASLRLYSFESLLARLHLAFICEHGFPMILRAGKSV